MATESVNTDRSVTFGHAVYGAIIITAELVIERDHADGAGEVIVVLLATGVVLLLAHSYASALALRSDGRPHKLGELALVPVEEAPVLTSLIIPLAAFVLAALDVLSLQTAFRVSIWSTVAFLFVIGLVESRRIGRSKLSSVFIGLVGAFIGVLVILLEVWIS